MFIVQDGRLQNVGVVESRTRLFCVRQAASIWILYGAGEDPEITKGERKQNSIRQSSHDDEFWETSFKWKFYKISVETREGSGTGSIIADQRFTR